MKNLGKMLTVAGLVGAIGIASIGTSVSAQNTDVTKRGSKLGENRPEMTEELKAEMIQHREAVREATENGDYATWQELMSENDRHPEILDTITADNFGQLQEMHQLMQAGDKEGAKAIADELGLKPPMHNKGQFKKQMNIQMKEHMEASREFVESGDYQGWYDYATQNGKTPPILEKINEDNFHLLGEMHEAKEAGDMDKVKEIADQLGFEKPANRFNKGQFKGPYLKEEA